MSLSPSTIKALPPDWLGLRWLSPPPLLAGEAGGTCMPAQPVAISNSTLGMKSGQANLARREFVQVKRFGSDQSQK